MRRTTDAQKAVDLYGPGKHGFKDGNPGLGIPSTRLNADWFNQTQEEIAAVIEGAGAVLDGANLHQLRDAITAMILAAVPAVPNYRRPHVASAVDYNLLVSQNAYVIEMTAPNKNINLPPVAGQNGLFATGINSSSGDITIDPSGSELLDGFTSRVMRPGDRVTWVCTGIGWITVHGVYSFVSTPTPYATATAYVFPHGLLERPTNYELNLNCVIPTMGWSVGDTLLLAAYDFGQTYGGFASMDATEVRILTQPTYGFLGRTKTGSSANLVYPAMNTFQVQCRAWVRKG